MRFREMVECGNEKRRRWGWVLGFWFEGLGDCMCYGDRGRDRMIEERG